jgi:hypothetical protein
MGVPATVDTSRHRWRSAAHSYTNDKPEGSKEEARSMPCGIKPTVVGEVLSFPSAFSLVLVLVLVLLQVRLLNQLQVKPVCNFLAMTSFVQRVGVNERGVGQTDYGR